MAYKRNYKAAAAVAKKKDFLGRLSENYDIVFYTAGAFILLAYLGYPLTKSQVEITTVEPGGKQSKL